MCLFAHVAAGALAGAFSPNSFLAPVFGLGSHVFLDVLPHYDFENMKVEIFLAACAIGILMIAGVFSLPIILGIVFAILPDLENLFWKLGKLRDDQKVFPGHVGFIPHGRIAGIGNLILQFAGSAVIIFYLIRRAA